MKNKTTSYPVVFVTRLNKAYGFLQQAAANTAVEWAGDDEPMPHLQAPTDSTLMHSSQYVYTPQSTTSQSPAHISN